MIIERSGSPTFCASSRWVKPASFRSIFKFTAIDIRIWIFKALATERFRYTAYDAAFGSEIDTLPGLSLNDEIAQSELKRFITEAIMVNPYIVELSNFLFKRTKSGMTVEFDCETVYGREHYTWESKGVSV